ncbi:small integral membrane protein 22 [Nerophis lumbriciformis]|uniref:small integral membrane protein 22 n=1 Tax=Nerophis lumbriciformis TaxID=546530 RepID=UPI002ADFA2F2|nr:small integral membrane protein 22-like [Nerophis lumbriciformis]
MGSGNSVEDLKDNFNDVVSRLQSKQLFQSDWDIVFFAVFFTFIGVIVLLGTLILIRCCCCCHQKTGRKKVGIDNLSLEP